MNARAHHYLQEKKVKRAWISLVLIIMSQLCQANTTYEKVETWANQGVKIVLEVEINREKTKLRLNPVLTIIEKGNSTIYFNISTQFATNILKEWDLLQENRGSDSFVKDVKFGNHTFQCVPKFNATENTTVKKTQILWSEAKDISLLLISISQISNKELPPDSQNITKTIIENKNLMQAQREK